MSMKVEQIYTGCLAEAAYYIESNGAAAVIDPLRETKPYIEKAQANGARLKYIFETHFHADFVSGHVELGAKTGATIVYGPGAECGFKCHSAKDGEEFKIGALTIKTLHTPGHTPESTTYLLKDEQGKAVCIFTGDTLFIGDVGRPDLAIKSNLTEEDLAGMLYDSLHNKIMPLPDDIIIYPAHGAGSSCGKNMSHETSDTLGHQKKVNYALRAKNKQEFIKEVTEGLAPPPQYFSKNAMLNKQGAQNLDTVYSHGLQALAPAQFEEIALSNSAMLLDTRDPEVFANGFVPGSINIGLNGQFAHWVGSLITDLKQPILIVCEAGTEEETVRRLARVGYDNTLGYLDGGIKAWSAAGKKTGTIRSINAGEFEKEWRDSSEVLDVRRANEYEAEHVANALNRPLEFINDWTGSLDNSSTCYLHCKSGYRSMISASILKARGVENIVNVAGGYDAIAKSNVPKTSFVNAVKS